MGVDGDAAAVVADGEPIGCFERDLDEGGVAGDCLVHGVVEDFGGEVVEGGFIRSANVHAGSAADRFEAFEDLDILSGIGIAGFGWLRRAEEVVHVMFAAVEGRTLAEGRGVGEE